GKMPEGRDSRRGTPPAGGLSGGSGAVGAPRAACPLQITGGQLGPGQLSESAQDLAQELLLLDEREVEEAAPPEGRGQARGEFFRSGEIEAMEQVSDRPSLDGQALEP